MILQKGGIALTCPNMLPQDTKTFRVSNEGRVHNAGVEILRYDFSQRQQVKYLLLRTM